MCSRRPVVNDAPASRPRPITGQQSQQKRWTFTFRFFRQIDFFGLDRQDGSWFASLLARLAALSEEPIERMRSDMTERDAWRYHQINWQQKNIPIQRNDLTWVTPHYRDNEAEYPLMQFMVSKSLGRVVGFWDENDVFNIVLLDPLHNIQPTQATAYRIDPCSPADCRFTALMKEVTDAQSNECIGTACPSHLALRAIPGFNATCTAMFITVDDSLNDKVAKSLNAGWTLSDIFELGLGQAAP